MTPAPKSPCPKWPDDYLIPGVTPYHVEEAGIIYCADCRDILPHLPNVDLVLTDPPYGIGNFVQISGNKRGKEVLWNDSIPNSEIFALIREAGKYRIIWGANYFNCFEKNGGAIVWVKNQPMPNFSKAEIASCSFFKKVEVYYQTWTNFLNTKRSIHPCERPINLYKWCIDYSPESDIILDPFLGSGTTAVAAKEMGRKFIGIEISEEYCVIAVKRLRQRVFNFE